MSERLVVTARADWGNLDGRDYSAARIRLGYGGLPVVPGRVGQGEPVLAPVLRVLRRVPFQIHAADAASGGVKAA